MARKDAPKTPAQYWQDLLYPGTKVPIAVGFQPAALFAVRKSTIQQRPLSFWESLLQEFFLGEMEHVNPETGHFLERFWPAIFNAKEYVLWTEDEIAKEERNEQGQLAKGRWHVTPKNVDVDERTLPPSPVQ